MFLRSFIWFWLIAEVGVSHAAAQSKIHVEIRPVGYSEKSEQEFERQILETPAAQARLHGARYRVIRRELSDMLVLHVYDYTHNQMLSLSGKPGRTEPVKIQSEPTYDPAPSPEELKEAISLLAQDNYFGPGVTAKALQPYQSMPGVLHANPDPGTWPLEGRVIAVGVIPLARRSLYHHEIVGVDLSHSSIIRYPAGAPPTALALDEMCGPWASGDWTTGQGVPGAAQVLVKDGDKELWSMTVTRPSASSGAWGSAVELTDVYYRGKRVLGRAGVPIFNVKYSRNVCGPYRDWSWQEHPYRAQGELMTDGILQSNSAPQTIFDTDDDSGDFRGVTVYTVNGVTTLISEMEAGWYRYLSIWNFYPDGTIEPRWGFGAVQDSCTCNLHFHHVYWRLDFDIGPTVNNRVEAYDGTQWKPVKTEAKQYRDGTHQAWRITDPKTGSGYVVIPGKEDQTAADDAYGQGDVWVVRARANQLDDYYNYQGTWANIDAFLQGDDVYDQDIVFWYGGHFVHDAAHEGGNERHILGPTLKPINW